MKYTGFEQECHNGNIHLYQMDCMELLRQTPDKRYDLCVVDPPYGIGVSNAVEIGYKGFNTFTPKDWDDSVPSMEYFNELQRVSVNQIVWGGNYFDLPQTRCFIVWDKGEGFKNRTFAECEMAWTSFDRNAKIYKRDPLANGDYKGKIHPTQKPVVIYDNIFRDFAEQGMKILDTHGGSMSSVISADKAGLEMVCCELDKEYFDKAVDRFQKYKSQLRLAI